MEVSQSKLLLSMLIPPVERVVLKKVIEKTATCSYILVCTYMHKQPSKAYEGLLVMYITTGAAARMGPRRKRDIGVGL